MIESGFFNVKFDVSNMNIKPYCEPWFTMNQNTYKDETSLEYNDIANLLNQLRIAEVYESLEIDVIGESLEGTDLANNNQSAIQRMAVCVNSIKIGFFELLEEGIVKTVRIYYPFVRVSTYKGNYLIIYTIFVEVSYLSGKNEFWIFEEIPDKPLNELCWPSKIEEYVDYIKGCLVNVRYSIFIYSNYSRYIHTDDLPEPDTNNACSFIRNYILLEYVKYNFGLDVSELEGSLTIGFSGDLENNIIKKDKNYQMSYDKGILMLSSTRDSNDYTAEIIEKMASFETYISCKDYFFKVAKKMNITSIEEKRIAIYGKYLNNFIKKNAIVCDRDLKELLDELCKERKRNKILFGARVLGMYSGAFLKGHED